MTTAAMTRIRVEREYGRLLLPHEAAAALGIHTKTLSRLAREGRIAAIRTPGGHRRYRQADVDAFTSQGPGVQR